MRDFADVPNSSGSYPSVTAVDCSGPGEVDGTADIADTLTDDWGWKQALLSEVSDTPNDSAESTTLSQIVDAIKMLPATYCISLLQGVSSEWDYLLNSGTPDTYWESNTNYGILCFPIQLPDVAMDVDITVRVQPGIARSSTNRMYVALLYQDTDEVLNPISSSVYDDSTANEQDIVFSLSSYTPAANRSYMIWVRAGNDGASNQDRVYTVKVEKSKP